ncbi:coenzyme F420-0:L-glutamate ligase [Candidatus Peregrinibacteria bacterium]|nr:coenzyme F420-0:L-glutamate ligase [Candidatus Peregrinibacteria bacterium]
MFFSGLKTSIFHNGEDLFSFFSQEFEKSHQKIGEKSVVIIASKVVSLSQNRVVRAEKSEMENWVKKESEKYWRTAFSNIFLSLKNGILIANAGIDASNAEKGELILWPENVQKFADEFRSKLKSKFKLHEIGVVIIDSRCTPLRTGTTGVALAWSGFEGVRDMRGKKDLFENTLEVTQESIADNLASAAELIMGNADESIPFVICENAPVEFTGKQQNPKRGVFSEKEDLFRVLWEGNHD